MRSNSNFKNKGIINDIVPMNESSDYVDLKSFGEKEKDDSIQIRDDLKNLSNENEINDLFNMKNKKDMERVPNWDESNSIDAKNVNIREKVEVSCSINENANEDKWNEAEKSSRENK